MCRLHAGPLDAPIVRRGLQRIHRPHGGDIAAVRSLRRAVRRVGRAALRAHRRPYHGQPRRVCHGTVEPRAPQTRFAVACGTWGLTTAGHPSRIAACAAMIKVRSTEPGCTFTRRCRRPRRASPLRGKPAAGGAQAATSSPRSGPRASSDRQRRSTSASLRRAMAAQGKHSQLKREQTRAFGATGEMCASR